MTPDDQRLPGEAFCADCPDHEGCSQAAPCWLAKGFHAPADGDLFAPRALCGATASDAPDGVLRLHAPGCEVTCWKCRALFLTEAT
jgi:hypothetical protein